MKRTVLIFILLITTSFSNRPAFAALPSQAVPAQDWYSQAVDQLGSDGSVGNHFLRFDSAHHPHAVYGKGADIDYAWYDGAGWQSEVVAQGGVFSMVLDAADQPHILYLANDALQYASRVGNTWKVSSLDLGVDYPIGSAGLVVDPAGNPAISYDYNHELASGGAAYGVKCAIWTGSTWEMRTVEEGVTEHTNFAVSQTSPALDSTGDLQVGYTIHLYGNELAKVKLAHWTGSDWDIQIVEQGDPIIPTIFTYIDLVLDAADQPHLAYNRTIGSAGLYTFSLHYASQAGAAWEIATVDEWGWYSGALSLALDSGGQPHVSYSKAGNLNYAAWDGAAWDIEPVGIADISSLAIDDQDRVSLLYQDAISGALEYAQRLPALALTKQAYPREIISAGAPLTYTLQLSGPAGHMVQLTDPLPQNVAYLPGSVTPPGTYDPEERAIVWQGALPDEGNQKISFQVTLILSDTQTTPLAPAIVNTAWLTDTQYSLSVSARNVVNGWHTYLPLFSH